MATLAEKSDDIDLNGENFRIQLEVESIHGAIRMYAWVVQYKHEPGLTREYCRPSLATFIWAEDFEEPRMPELNKLMEGYYGQEYADFLNEWKDKLSEQPISQSFPINKERSMSITPYPNGYAIVQFIKSARGRYYDNWLMVDNFPPGIQTIKEEVKPWAVKHLDPIAYMNLKDTLEQYGFRW